MSGRDGERFSDWASRKARHRAGDLTIKSDGYYISEDGILFRHGVGAGSVEPREIARTTQPSFFGTAIWGFQSTANPSQTPIHWKWGPEVYDKSNLPPAGAPMPKYEIEYQKCCVCGEDCRAILLSDRCQICGGVYHNEGCGISTLSSFTCKKCMAEGRMPKGYVHE